MRKHLPLLLAAGVLLRLPTKLAIFVGILGTYWSWSLAMYRETGDGHPGRETAEADICAFFESMFPVAAPWEALRDS